MRGRRGGYHTPVGANCAARDENPKDLRPSAQRKAELQPYCGQAAPLSTQTFIAATNFGRLRGGSVRPSPGFHPQPTRSSDETCSMICARVRLPFFAGSFSWRQNCPAVSPWMTIFMFAGGSDHFGFPGGIL